MTALGRTRCPINSSYALVRWLKLHVQRCSDTASWALKLGLYRISTCDYPRSTSLEPISTMVKLPESQSPSPEPIIPRDPEAAKNLASHALLSRLVACVINEGLGLGVFNKADKQGIILPLDFNASLDEIRDKDRITFPLRETLPHTESIPGHDGSLLRIIYIDPEDIPRLNPLLYYTVKPYGSPTPLTKGTELMNLVRSWNPAIQTPRLDDAMGELTDCLNNAVAMYMNPPSTPSLEMDYNDWEQSLVEGHSTHPARIVFPAAILYTTSVLTNRPFFRCSYAVSLFLHPLSLSPSPKSPSSPSTSSSFLSKRWS